VICIGGSGNTSFAGSSETWFTVSSETCFPGSFAGSSGAGFAAWGETGFCLRGKTDFAGYKLVAVDLASLVGVKLTLLGNLSLLVTVDVASNEVVYWASYLAVDHAWPVVVDLTFQTVGSAELPTAHGEIIQEYNTMWW